MCIFCNATIVDVRSCTWTCSREYEAMTKEEVPRNERKINRTHISQVYANAVVGNTLALGGCNGPFYPCWNAQAATVQHYSITCCRGCKIYNCRCTLHGNLMTNTAALSCPAQHYSILLHQKALENCRSESSAAGRGNNRKKPVATLTERMALTAVITGSAAAGNEGWR